MVNLRGRHAWRRAQEMAVGRFCPAFHRVFLTWGSGWPTEELTPRSPQCSWVDSYGSFTVLGNVKSCPIYFYLWKIELLMPTLQGLHELESDDK